MTYRATNLARLVDDVRAWQEAVAEAKQAVTDAEEAACRALDGLMFYPSAAHVEAVAAGRQARHDLMDATISLDSAERALAAALRRDREAADILFRGLRDAR